MARGEGVKKLGDLFTKYQQTLKAPESHVITTATEVIQDIIGVSIPKEKISYNVARRHLRLTVSGPIKTEVLLHREDILRHLKGRLGVKNAPTEIL